MSIFKKLRVFILLAVLFVVGVNEWRDRGDAIAWNRTLRVSIFPINAEGSEAVAKYIATLENRHFDGVEEFFDSEMARYGLTRKRALDIRVGPSIVELPPVVSSQPGMLESVMWSLRLRWWAWRNTPKLAVKPQIRLYVLYHDAQTTESVSHSRGLQKGRLGIVNAFSGRTMHGTTSFVITHELMHTLGATDKYDLSSGEPFWPEGYAVPDRDPLYPQKYAEIMGGRIPVSAKHSELPTGLWDGMVGDQTAAEIGWRAPNASP